MNSKPLIIANWKCNPGTQKEAEHLFATVKKETRKLESVEIVICPPFIYLPFFQQGQKKTGQNNIVWLGAQDCFWEDKGAFTGEISVSMLKDLNCKYVIIGHSERKKYFKETDETINKKLKLVLKNRLKPIFCVGEESRDSFNSEGKSINEMSLVVSEQIERGLSSIPQARIADVIIVYEPVWAIGSGIPCLADDAMKAALLIRKTLTGLYNRQVAERVKILYGGSVMSQNAVDYIKEANLDGLLIGGASLNATEFIKIAKNIIE